MYRVITCNTNGIRAAARKASLAGWLTRMQRRLYSEIKAKEVQLTDNFFILGYCFYNEAERPGYAGTAIFSKKKPQKVTTRLDWELIDLRAVTFRSISGLSVVSLYVPWVPRTLLRRAKTVSWTLF